jgi:hypothetical protein
MVAEKQRGRIFSRPHEIQDGTFGFRPTGGNIRRPSPFPSGSLAPVGVGPFRRIFLWSQRDLRLLRVLSPSAVAGGDEKVTILARQSASGLGRAFQPSERDRCSSPQACYAFFLVQLLPGRRQRSRLTSWHSKGAAGLCSWLASPCLVVRCHSSVDGRSP